MHSWGNVKKRKQQKHVRWNRRYLRTNGYSFTYKEVLTCSLYCSFISTTAGQDQSRGREESSREKSKHRRKRKLQRRLIYHCNCISMISKKRNVKLENSRLEWERRRRTIHTLKRQLHKMQRQRPTQQQTMQHRTVLEPRGRRKGENVPPRVSVHRFSKAEEARLKAKEERNASKKVRCNLLCTGL